MKNTQETNKTDFQGAVSLDAILAATSGKKGPEEIKVQKPEPEKKKPVEPKVAKPKVESPEAPIEIPEEPIQAVEVIKEVVEEAPKKEDVQEPEKETDSYFTAKRLLDLGIMEDFKVQTSEDDEEGTLVSEFTSMTEEQLQEIISIHKQEKQEEIASKYLPKGDLKEHQLKVFEILSNGGDLSQIAETPEKALERPFEGFDMTDQQRQIDVRYTDLVHARGLDHDSAVTIIENEIKNGKLEKNSQDIFDSYREAHEDYINKILEKQKKDKEIREFNLKENKKLLSAKLKEAGLKEAGYRKVTAEYEKKNNNGDHALMDKVREMLDDPEKYYEVILHIADKELFNESFKIKASQEATKKIVRLASGAGTRDNKKPISSQVKKEDTPWSRFAEEYNRKIKN